jgi:hypothetical protein
MGADGHINIYDLDAIEKEVTREELESVTSCSQVYRREIFGRRVLTEYYGDNIYSYADSYDDMFGYTKEDSPYYISREKFNSIWDLIKKHKITSWEVWT